MSAPDDDGRAATEKSLDRVQRRVAAIIFVVVTGHALLGILGAAAHFADSRRADAVLLLVVGAPVSAAIYVLTRVILRGRLFSPWILVAVAPWAATAWIVLPIS